MNKQKRFYRLVCGPVAAASLVAACAMPQQLEIIEREQRRLRAEASTARGEASGARVELERVRSSLADTRANLQEIQRDVNALKGRIDELKYLIERQAGQSSREGEQKLRALDERLAKLEQDLSAQGKLLKAHEDNLRELREQSARSADATVAKAPPVVSGAGESDAVKRDYEAALKIMDQKDYRQAIVRFREFLKKYPTSELADNAQYWIGECHYALKEYDQAILEFDQVRRKYPKGDKVPAALLKQGFAFAELGDRLDARLILQELIDRYPLSAEASRAKEKLKSLQS
ncbi:MAG TPA: tol-pal system protein YbgF [Candidatus Acidoferrales bacterium]|nr:tol-pal system protein YbgF [Candidatus Acidoferrales bacterium]